jgi:hypothetical protein
MKKVVAILEIILLLFILYGFAWACFDDKISNPFSREVSLFRVLISVGLVAVLGYRVFQLLFLIIRGRSINSKLQLVALGLYLIMILPDLYSFISLNVYGDEYFYVTVILFTPIIIGVISILGRERKKGIFNKNNVFRGMASNLN